MKSRLLKIGDLILDYIEKFFIVFSIIIIVMFFMFDLKFQHKGVCTQFDDNWNCLKFEKVFGFFYNMEQPIKYIENKSNLQNLFKLNSTVIH